MTRTKGKTEISSQKEKQVPKKVEKSLEKAMKEVEEMEEELNGLSSKTESAKESNPVKIKASKPIAQIKKDDKIKIDNVVYEVDAHEVLIEHGATKEMAIEIFNPKTDKDYQLRYFSDQIETSLELYELEEIVYVKRNISVVEW